MSRKARQQEIETAVQPLLSRGEQVRRSGPAWAVEQRGRAPLVFRARDLHQVVLTDQRLVLLTQPRRRRPLGVNNLVIAKKYSTFGLDGVKRLRPMLQVRVRAPDGRVLVLEFRPRDRRLGRELAEELSDNGDNANGNAGPRPRALPAAPAVPVQPDHAPAPVAPAYEPPTYAAPAPAPAPAPVRPHSFPVPIQPVDAPGSEGVWPPQESEGGSRKERRAAKKQAKQEAKEARQAEKQAKKQATGKSSEHQEMLDYLQK